MPDPTAEQFKDVAQYLREAADAGTLTAESARSFTGTLNYLRKETVDISKALNTTLTFQRDYLNQLRIQRDVYKELGANTKDIDDKIKSFSQNMGVASIGVGKLFQQFKNGGMGLDEFVAKSGGPANALKGVALEMGRVGGAAYVLKESIKLFSDLTVGVARASVSVERAMPNLTYEQMAGSWTAPLSAGGGVKAQQDLMTFGASLGYGAKETREVTNTLAQLGLAAPKYTETALIAQRMMGMDAKTSGEAMKYLTYRVHLGADQASGELLRLRNAAAVTHTPMPMMAEAYNQILGSSGGMNINLKHTSKLLQIFAKNITDGTINFNNLVTGLRGMEPGKIVGFMNLAGATEGKSPLANLNQWYGKTTLEQMNIVGSAMQNVVGKMGLGGEEKKGMTRLWMMNIPGIDQFARFEPKKFDKMVEILSEGGRINKDQQDLIDKAGQADKQMYDDATKSAQHLGVIEEGVKAIVGIMLNKTTGALNSGMGAAGQTLGELIAAWNRVLNDNTTEASRRRDRNPPKDPNEQP